MRRFLRLALEQGGYESIEAADGNQALERATAQNVDLAISGLVMPEKKGLETIRALHQSMPGVGIIAISGAFGGRFLVAVRLLGADEVLGKPVSPEKLLARIKEVLAIK